MGVQDVYLRLELDFGDVPVQETRLESILDHAPLLPVLVTLYLRGEVLVLYRVIRRLDVLYLLVLHLAHRFPHLPAYDRTELPHLLL